MARIELRDCTIRIKDGLSGTAAVNDMSLMTGDTTFSVNNVVLNTTDTDLIPIGARFTIASESGSPVHTVTGRSGNPTTSITFTPGTASGVSTMAVITFLPQQIDIKVGDGDLTYTEKNEYTYELDRGELDTVREGDDQPLEVSIDMVYEHITTGTSENVSPMDALKGVGGASEWVSASPDLCEPYSVDLEVVQEAPCGTSEDETTSFPDFRSESREISLRDATIKVTGKCNVTVPTVSRS